MSVDQCLPKESKRNSWNQCCSCSRVSCRKAETGCMNRSWTVIGHWRSKVRTRCNFALVTTKILLSDTLRWLKHSDHSRIKLYLMGKLWLWMIQADRPSMPCRTTVHQTYPSFITCLMYLCCVDE